MTLRIILYTLFEVFLESDDDGDRTKFTAISSVNTILNFAWQQQWYHSWLILVVANSRYYSIICKILLLATMMRHSIQYLFGYWYCQTWNICKVSVTLYCIIYPKMTLLNIYLNGDSTKKFVFLMSSSFVVVDDTGLGYVLSCPIMVIHVYVSTCLGHQKYCLILWYK